MKALLVQPPVFGMSMKNRMIEPLALEILAAGIIDEHEVKILDLRVEDRFEQECKEYQPDVIAITCYICLVDVVRRLARKAKSINPRMVVVVGGEQPTHVPEEFNIPEIDYILRGDGDRSFPLMFKYLEGKCSFYDVPGMVKVEQGILKYGKEKEVLTQLCESPIPARHLVARYKSYYRYMGWNEIGSISTSRGCKNRCKFCSIWRIRNGIVAHFPLERVIKELKSMEQRNIYFCEAHSFQDYEYMEKLADLIIENQIDKRYMMYIRADTVVKTPELLKKWYDIGLRRVFIGFESITNNRLNKYNKESISSLNDDSIKVLHGIGIEIVGSFIIDLDFEEEDFEILKKWVIDRELTLPAFNILTPLPGTDLYEKNREFIKKVPYENFDFSHAILPTKLPLKRFYQLLADLYRDTYSAPISKELAQKLGYTEKMLADRKKVGELLALNYCREGEAYERFV